MSNIQSKLHISLEYGEHFYSTIGKIKQIFNTLNQKAEIISFYFCSDVFSVRMHSLWLNVAIRFGLIEIFEYACTVNYISSFALLLLVFL